ncbi:aryl hydrocarbon receptor nuclear translocator-like protein 1 isoform X2 [Dreissena polymorpha]|uniref:aryl hydrocarbon receptor nuclear translocator-like protein 1 isoform X2 n=1 Tax=Dreissena polymorpha TaxID=45954 RepID=UPI0022650A84|nr:aryl hydrocarbon receptor nuclear translocator-like protein 1 isoform X2 [Dreissena polymorpha]
MSHVMKKDFFSQQHDWMLPIMDQPELTQVGFPVDLGYYQAMDSMPGLASSPYPSPNMMQPIASPSTPGGSSYTSGRKRKGQNYDVSSFEGDDDEDSMDPENTKKQNHSEIEKRRRDKMNTYIMQLSTMLPMCSSMNRKCDKLTVLRMAVQHMKALRGSSTSFPEAMHKPSFLSDQEVKQSILEAADGFLFVVGCDRARILFVSESVSNILQYTRNELIGQSLFDFIHPRDISKVKEQFSSSDLAPRERLIDAKTLMPLKTELPQCPTHLCSGARRSFYCRMKYRIDNGEQSKSGLKYEKEDLEYVHRKRKSDQKSYIVIHFTGYLKSWPTSKINITGDDDYDDSSNILSCLVAVGQIRTSFNQPVQ